ncbi:MAG: ABC transporter permease [Chloroflexi bacterium]|nr:ABC transporter permease [Chloroflexota bacterium]
MTGMLKKLKEVKRETWISVLAAAFLLGMWEAAVDLNWVNSAFIVSPSTIVTATVRLGRSGNLGEHVYTTLIRMILGFLAGSIPGLIIGLAMGWSKTLRAILDPVVSVVYPLPKIALLPLIMLVVGIGESPIILLIALGAFFPVLINCIAGVNSIAPIYFDVAQNYGASRFKTFTRVILPGSLPVALAGFRLALGISLLLTVVAELTIATKGIGAMLWLSWQTLRVERIYVAIAVIAALGLILNWLLGIVSRRIVPWRESQ